MAPALTMTLEADEEGDPVTGAGCAPWESLLELEEQAIPSNSQKAIGAHAKQQ
jgi:hypothetical protein